MGTSLCCFLLDSKIIVAGILELQQEDVHSHFETKNINYTTNTSYFLQNVRGWGALNGEYISLFIDGE